MTLQELLNADVNISGQSFKEGWRWWIAELVDLVPAPLRGLVAGRAPVEFAYKDGEIRALNGDHPNGEHRSTRPPVRLMLERNRVLRRSLNVPPLAARDLRRMFDLDIDRLTPFRADTVFIDAVVSRDAPDRAMLGVALRDDVVAAIERALALGLRPVAVGVSSEDLSERRLDFMPAARAAGSAPNSRNFSWLWAFALVLVIANLVTAVTVDMMRTKAMQGRLDALEPQANLVRSEQHLVLSERARRSMILARREQGEPISVLNTLTDATPIGAWVDRLAFDGKSIRASGFRRDDVDVLAAWRRTQRLASARNTASEFQPPQPAGIPFDLTADVRP